MMLDEHLCLFLQDKNMTIQDILTKVRETNTHEINSGRTKYGEYHHLFPLLKKYEVKFQQYMRMKTSTFQYVLVNVKDLLTRNWCNLHTQPIEPEERLVVTIRFLATGMSYTDLAFSFRMGVSTVSTIVKETMAVLWDRLYPIHMPIPSTEKFKEIAEEFYSKWNFPHCIGAIDGRHVRIKCPAKSGSLYYNYKHFFSIVLQAVVDARYKFIVIDVGGYGHQSDGGTFQASSLYKTLVEKVLKIPDESNLPGSQIVLPYYFIGDGAYPLMEHLMKPYPGEKLPPEKEYFNKRLSRARMVVERAFGMVCQKWRIFYTTIQQPPEIVNFIVKSTCILHNVIIDFESDYYENSSSSASIGNTFEAGNEGVNDFIVGYGKEVRKELTKFFMNDVM